MCVLIAGLAIIEAATPGRRIAMDAWHGVIRLVLSIARLRAFSSSLCSVVKFLRHSLSRCRLIWLYSILSIGLVGRSFDVRFDTGVQYCLSSVDRKPKLVRKNHMET